MSQAKDERRYKILLLSGDEILKLCRIDPIQIFRLKGIPERPEIVNISFSFMHNSFALLLAHDFFPIVPASVEAPILEAEIQWIALTSEQQRKMSNFLGHL